MQNTNISPVKPSERYIILDALRGFALLGICLANYPEFSLYTFQSSEIAAAMPSAGVDRIVRFLQYMMVDGKFYTLFSLLFGMGFSIIISHAAQRGAGGFRLFYRRMAVLLLIGFIHLMFIWSGDILMLYALMGMALPLFRNVSDRGLLCWAAAFVLLPIVVDTAANLAGVSLSAPAVRAQWHYCRMYGITEENFGYWLRDADTYKEVFQFLVQGALVRVQEFVDGNRYFKVMGLFILGFYIGRRRMYADLENHKRLLHNRRSPIAGLCLERRQRPSFGHTDARHSLSRKRLSDGAGIHVGAVPHILTQPQRRFLEMDGGAGQDGVDKLYRSVCYRNVPFLWHRHGTWSQLRPYADRDYGALRVRVPSAVEQPLAKILPVRTARMDMENAQLRQKTETNKTMIIKN